jgi:hypothetical protein
MSSSTISKNEQLYSGYDTRSVADSQVYNLLYNADVWVDASDTSSFSLTGTGIQQILSGNWNDKSRNANNLVPTAANIFHDAGNRGFALNTQYFMPTNVIRSSNTESFFLVLSFWGSQISGTQYVLGFNPSSGAGQRWFRIDTAGLISHNNGTALLTGAVPVTEARRVLIEFTNNNGFLQHFINGRLTGTAAALTAFTSTNATSFFGSPTANTQLRATVHECLFYSSCVSASQRQLIEYYLINKWKVPTTAITNPTSISGCRLWLDASDASSITLSGSSVTQWNDKSGQSNHAVGVTSYLPTYTSSPAQVNFNAAQALRSNYVISSSTETIFVVMKSTTVGANSQYFIDSSDTANGRNYRLTASGSNKWFAARGGSNILSGVVAFTTQSYATNVLYCATTGSTGITQFINKTNDITSTTANTSVSGTFTQIGARSNPPATGLNGSISEIVAYNVILSPSDRELVANYLMNKWSIPCLTGTSINVYNAYQRIPPPIRYFTPNDIDNCSLWLDASDRTTLFQNSAGTTAVTSTGQTVNHWKDKSPNNCNATNSVNLGGVSAYASRNGLDTISFAINSYLSLSTSLMPTGTQYGISIFAVCITTISATQCVISWGTGNANASATVYYGYIVDTPNNSSRPFVGTTTGNSGISNNSISRNNYILLSSTSTSSTQQPILLSGWFNGSAFTSGTSGSTFTSPIGTTFASIGAYFGSTPASQYLTGNIGEIIVYNRLLGNGEREMIEGYLADKWGFRTNLPSTHTIKDIISLAPAFTPKSISHCQMWYDASDLSTFTYASGSTVNVTNMRDKSGFGFDLVRDIYTAGREVTTANKLNGLTTLTFPGDPAGNNSTLSYLRTTVSVPLNSNSNYVFFVMRFNPFVLEGTTTARSWPFIFPFQIGVTNGLQGGLTRTGTNWTLNYNIAFVGTGANGTAVVSNSSSGPSVGTPFIGMFGKTGAAQYVFSYNGTYETVTGLNATIAGGQPFSMAPFYQAQELCEMIYYTGRVLTVGEIAKIDGYLAWKWGLQGNLPAGHPYKKYAP